VTCGGAKTRDFFSSQYQGVPPQLNSVTKQTQLVTMTIGGNDSNVFINAIVDCGSAGISTLGQGSPCKDRYGASFQYTIRKRTYPALVRALRAVRARAPRARVAILGYPWILPPTEGCYPTMPVARGDVPYLHGIQATLNDAIRRPALATDVTYVNFNTISVGHDACKRIGVRWIEPVVGTTNPVIVHPNALGEARTAAHTMQVLHLR
jgi:lysophospholipase L1-like esterase